MRVSLLPKCPERIEVIPLFFNANWEKSPLSPAPLKSMIKRSGEVREKVLYCTGPLRSNTRRSLSSERHRRALRICVA